MTYNVFNGTLNLTQPTNLRDEGLSNVGGIYDLSVSWVTRLLVGAECINGVVG